MKKFQIIFFFFFMFTGFIKAQIPVNDAGWTLQSAKSDSFSGSAISLSKWDTTWNYYGSGNNVNTSAEWCYGKNDSVGGGYLYLKADSIKPPYKVAAWGSFPDCEFGTYGQSLSYAYQGAVAMTDSIYYKFGYIEISAKFPSKKWPLWPAFWLFGNNCPPGSDYLNEIDIVENSAPTTFAGNKVGNNIHVSAITCVYDSTDTYNALNEVAVLPATDSLSGAFHKYAFEWSPRRMTFYFDDVPTIIVNDATGARIPQNRMRAIFSFAISPWESYLPSNWNNVTTYGNPPVHGDETPTKWPQHLVVDYMNYYTLGVDCSNPLSVCIPSDYSARKVQQYITVGGGACTPNFNPSTTGASYTLRATEYVLLDAGTTINPSGSGYFAIDIIQCPQ